MQGGGFQLWGFNEVHGVYVLDGAGASWSNRFWGQVEMVGLMR